MTNSEIIVVIESSDAGSGQVEEAWNDIQRCQAVERKQLELEVDKLRLEVELKKTSGGRAVEEVARKDLYDLSKLLQPFTVGPDIGLYLVNFEGACENAQFGRSSCPRRLLGLLPCEAADVIARLWLGL
ncbi:hypothetical protein V5799_025475 [Amblyomma americanum]|uniref:Uncharacterized protein n=1 Tax=Amblyomma americanum TaxID=6943 RepID=A0AAQ4E9F2_AMBAM